MAHILVVEDNQTNLDMMTYLLKSFGHSYVIALTGPEALLALRAERVDLVMCDLQLPGLDGYAVVQQARKDGHTGPMVAVSSFAMVGDREKALAAGFDAYIAKPIDPERFLGQLDEIMKQN